MFKFNHPKTSHHEISTKQSKTTTKTPEALQGYTDFSGEWHGMCHFMGEEATGPFWVSIQNNGKLVSYAFDGGHPQEYHIGKDQSEDGQWSDGVSVSHTIANWHANKTKLLFNDLFFESSSCCGNDTGEPWIVYSNIHRMTWSLENNKLIMRATVHEFEDNDFEYHSSSMCEFYKQS